MPDVSAGQFQGKDLAAASDNSQPGQCDSDTESDIPNILSGEYSLYGSPMGSDIVTTPGSNGPPVDQYPLTPDYPGAPTPRPRRVRYCADRYGSNIHDMCQSVYPSRIAKRVKVFKSIVQAFFDRET